MAREPTPAPFLCLKIKRSERKKVGQVNELATISAENSPGESSAAYKRIFSLLEDVRKDLEHMPKRTRRQVKRTNIYFAQGVNGGPVKIGAARDVENRLQELQVGSPIILRVMKQITNVDMFAEGKLHKKYADYRLHGEWFDECILQDVLEVLS